MIDDPVLAAATEPADRPPATRSNPPGVLALLAEPNLRRLWAAQSWSAAGEALAQIAMPLLVYSLTGSAALVGFIALVLILPRVVLAPIAGLLADRLNRRRLIILADAERLVLVTLVPFAAEIWQIAVLAVGIALGDAVARPAELALVPSVAGPDRLVPALSLVQVTRGIIRVVIPAAGAGIIATSGPGPAFWIQSLCFIGSLFALRKLVVPSALHSTVDDRAEPGGLWQSARQEIGEGLRAVRAIPIVRGVTASEMLWQLVSGALVVTAVVYTQETLQLAARADAAFALMTTSFSAGAVLGALVASRVELRIGRPRLMAIGYLGPLFLLAAFFTPPLPVIYAAWFALGFTDAWAVISFQAYLAEAVPERLRGRVYATWGAVVALAAAIFFYLMGIVTPLLGAPLTFALVGLIVGLGGPLLLWLTGALQSIRHHGPTAA
ncbi:MAG: MFS transporter [Chloroflexota bacterium]|nr:MFS transporter [Chloroflexota bacterium]